MNREQAITALGDRNNLLWGMSKEKKKYYSEAFDMAISALSEKDWKFYYDHGYAQAKRDLSENKGEWIASDHGMGLVYLKCPFCGAYIDKRHVEHNFCGKCGAKLSGEKSGFER